MMQLTHRMIKPQFGCNPIPKGFGLVREGLSFTTFCLHSHVSIESSAVPSNMFHLASKALLGPL
jgi:hypothetical protein